MTSLSWQVLIQLGETVTAYRFLRQTPEALLGLLTHFIPGKSWVQLEDPSAPLNRWHIKLKATSTEIDM